MNKQQIINYINSLKAKDYGFYLQSQYKQRTLMSSAFSIITLELIDGMNVLDKNNESSYFLSSQDPNTGLFIDPDVIRQPKNISDLGYNYIHYQTTAFSISSLDALGTQPEYPFHFLNPFRNREYLKNWLFKLDWSNPWLESNKVMFLLQFFSYEDIRNNNNESKALVLYLLDLLNKMNDPITGYWGTNLGSSYFNAMAGAFHFYNHYKYYDKEIPNKRHAFINTINMQEKDGLFHPLGGGGACEDLDAVDIIHKIFEHHKYGKNALIKAYNSIINSQMEDGGFCWAKRPQFPLLFGIKHLNPFNKSFHSGMCKWIIKRNILGSLLTHLKDPKMYQYSGWELMKYNIDESDGWSTWFRILALATIEANYPHLKKHDIDFNFRSLPSLGWQYVN